VSDFINGPQGGNPAGPRPGPGPAPIPPEFIEQMRNPPKIDFSFVAPTMPPPLPPARPEPFATLREIRWEWVAGILVVSVLVGPLLRRNPGRKQTGP
jgi:hypothetical protein